MLPFSAVNVPEPEMDMPIGSNWEPSRRSVTKAPLSMIVEAIRTPPKEPPPHCSVAPESMVRGPAVCALPEATKAPATISTDP